MEGDSAGSNPRLCLEKVNRRNEQFITFLCSFFCLGPQGGRRCRITLECKEKVYFFRAGPYAMLFWLAHHACYSKRWKLVAIQ